MNIVDDVRIKVVSVNKKARFNYHIEEQYEAGIALTGTEIKSVRLGRVSLGEAYAAVVGNEVTLHNMHIAPYEQGNRYNHDPKRPRRLLLHAKEIARLVGLVRQKGLTLIPLRMYLKGSWAKVELGVGKGKKKYDKRREIAASDARRNIDRALKERAQGHN